VRVILLDAEGPSFSAGLDRALLVDTGPRGLLGSLAAAGVEGAAARIAEFQRGFTWWAAHPAVSIAAVAGHAIGAGFQLALACDLRIIADDARFAMREVSYGLVPDLAGTAPLIAAVGYPAALEICATGRTVDAGEAVARGLALRAVPRNDLPAAAAALADALLAADPAALRAMKPLLRDVAGAEQPTRERSVQAGLIHARWSGKDLPSGGVAADQEVHR
jgi:enoyl-CoA hydratase/carnithine racemase